MSFLLDELLATDFLIDQDNVRRYSVEGFDWLTEPRASSAIMTYQEVTGARFGTKLSRHQ